MTPDAEETLRSRIGKLLSGGLNTPWTERALVQQRLDSAVRALQELAKDDLVGKLVVAGFTLRPLMPRDGEDSIEHSCKSCMYYERHRRFCNLPELLLPVEPQWSCIVWRI